MHIASGVFFVLFGLFFVVFHTKLSLFAINRWYKIFPHIRIWEKGYDIFFIGCGTVFVVFGLLSIFQIIRFKWFGGRRTEGEVRDTFEAVTICFCWTCISNLLPEIHERQKSLWRYIRMFRLDLFCRSPWPVRPGSLPLGKPCMLWLAATTVGSTSPSPGKRNALK